MGCDPVTVCRTVAEDAEVISVVDTDMDAETANKC